MLRRAEVAATGVTWNDAIHSAPAVLDYKAEESLPLSSLSTSSHLDIRFWSPAIMV